MASLFSMEKFRKKNGERCEGKKNGSRKSEDAENSCISGKRKGLWNGGMKLLNEIRKMVLRLSVIVSIFCATFTVCDETVFHVPEKRLTLAISVTWLFIMYFANYRDD